MSGQARTVKTKVIPPPTDGLNLISSPVQFKLTEARELKNYWVYDSGIRQMPDVGINKQYSGANANCDILTNYASMCIYSQGGKVYKLTSGTSTTPVDITGAATITRSEFNPCIFNKRLFLFNGVDAPLQHDFGGGNVAAFSATGPTLASLKQACGYKSRMYIVEASTTYWYGGVDAYSGAFTSVDLGSIISQANSYFVCVFNWTFNQGTANQEFLVFVTNQGEVLIYSGDYPGASNWTLIGRSFMPTPAGVRGGTFAGQPFYRIANDTYILTTRGMIPFSTVFAGAALQDGYYNISRRIKNQLLNASLNSIVVDRTNPFLYSLSESNTQQLFVMNYETGAWSVYAPTLPNGELIISLGFFGQYLMLGTGTPLGTFGGVYYLDTTAMASSTLTYTWKTPFFNLDSVTQKQLKMLRVVGLNYGHASVFKNVASVSTEFVDPASPQTAQAQTNVAADTNALQELSPPGAGRWLSLCFSRQGVDGINECNEIQGVEVYYEDGGGVY